MNIPKIIKKKIKYDDIQFNEKDIENVHIYSIGYNLGDLLEMPALYLSDKTLKFWKKKYHEKDEKMKTEDIIKHVISLYPKSILDYYYSSDIPKNELKPNKNRLLNAINKYEEQIDISLKECIKFVQNDNVLCVHLRCGDVSIDTNNEKYYDPDYTEFVKSISVNFKYVLIFTGLIPGYSSRLGYENVRNGAYNHIKTLLDKIPNSHVLIHGSIDDHLSILKHCKNVVLHRGGISQILSIICTNNIYINNTNWWKGKITDKLLKNVSCKNLIIT